MLGLALELESELLPEGPLPPAEPEAEPGAVDELPEPLAEPLADGSGLVLELEELPAVPALSSLRLQAVIVPNDNNKAEPTTKILFIHCAP